MIIMIFTSSGHSSSKFLFLLSGDMVVSCLDHAIANSSTCSRKRAFWASASFPKSFTLAVMVKSFTLTVMIKSFTLAVVIKSFTLAVVIKSFTLAVMMGFACLTAGSTPDTYFCDVLHLVRLRGNLRARALVVILTLLDFLCFLTTVWVVLALWRWSSPCRASRASSRSSGATRRWSYLRNVPVRCESAVS